MAKKKEKDDKKKNPNGRPVVYTKEFIEAEADALEKWMQNPKSIFFKRFAFDRGYSHNRLPEFAEVNKKFSVTFNRAREWQEIRLAEGGLTSEFNGGFCKFVMGNACGWHDKSETKITGDLKDALSFALNNVEGKTKKLVKENDSD